MPFVLDASTTLAWLFEDETSEYAERVLDRLQDDTALVPGVWPLEVANSLIFAERKGRITSAGLTRSAEVTRNLPVLIMDMSATLAFGAVVEVARSQELTAYDAAYLELAMREGVPIATQDKPLLAAAERVGVAHLE